MGPSPTRSNRPSAGPRGRSHFRADQLETQIEPMDGGPAGRLSDRRGTTHEQGPVDGGVPMGWADCGSSHRAAGHLWNLAGVEPGFIEIVVDWCLRSESVIVHRLPAPPQWILHRDSIPVCDPTTTIFSTRGRAPSVQTGGRPRPRDEVEADPRRPTERPPRPSGAPWPQRDLDHQKAPRGKRPGCGPHCKHPRRSPKPIDQEVRASASCSPVQRL